MRRPLSQWKAPGRETPRLDIVTEFTRFARNSRHYFCGGLNGLIKYLEVSRQLNCLNQNIRRINLSREAVRNLLSERTFH